ncbi:natterin-3 isoform X2 [Galendromus occidentalis]|uniref:Natterin-3 isoform X2 n=1 Tax=Galendromus occidentalis TaxID=34638 RepID=A0AAJ7P9L7_9ACAR|nr:natterin-3 isoform X2 [Galendromus occidentalis]
MSYNYRALCQWVPTNGCNIPPQAVHGGEDSSGETLYIGRARHSGDIVPGKVVPSHSCCYVAWGGQENSHRDYEILVTHSESEFAWEHASQGRLPAGALQGGVTTDGEPLYIGRVHHEGSLTIGKVQPSHGVCYIPYGGQEVPHTDYEVLVCKVIRLSF